MFVKVLTSDFQYINESGYVQKAMKDSIINIFARKDYKDGIASGAIVDVDITKLSSGPMTSGRTLANEIPSAGGVDVESTAPLEPKQGDLVKAVFLDDEGAEQEKVGEVLAIQKKGLKVDFNEASRAHRMIPAGKVIEIMGEE